MLKNKNPVLLVMLLLCLIAAVVLQSQLPMSWDNSWLLLMTRRWLAGGSYTHDFFDPDPPMILYVYSLPALLVKWSGLSVAAIFRSYIFTLSIVCLLVSDTFSAAIFRQDKDLRGVWLIALALVFWLVPAFEFGQRDYLVLLLLTPYLLSVLAQLRGVLHMSFALAMTVSAMAAVAIGIKPYYLGMVVLSEIVLVLQARQFLQCLRVEIIVLVSLLIGYVISVHILFPDYITTVVPFALRLYPGAMGKSLVQMISSYQAIYCCAVIVSVWLVPARGDDKHVLRYLGLLLAGFIAVFIYQRNIFYYHFIPAFSYAILVSVLAVTLLLTKLSPARSYTTVKLAICVLFLTYLFFLQRPIWSVVYFYPVIFYSYLTACCFLVSMALRREVIVKNALLAIVTVGFVFLFAQCCYQAGYDAHPLLVNLVAVIILFAMLVPAESIYARCSHAVDILLVAVVFAFPSYFVITLVASMQQTAAQVQLPLQKEFERAGKSGAVAVFIAQITDTFPALENAHVDYASRMPFLWMIPTLSVEDPTPASDRDATLAMLAADLNERKPATVYVDIRAVKPYLNAPFDYLSFMQQSLAFQVAWRHYHYVKTFVIHNDVFHNLATVKFAVYQRDPAG